MEHPLVGCGIGQFGGYTAGVDTEAGTRAGWQGTHNTYTQVSSEAGIPALIAYLVLLVSCFRSVGACYRRAVKIQTTRARDVANVAYALRTWLWTYAVFTMFTYVAYSAALPLIAGLTVGFFAIAQPELALAEREAAEAGTASVAGIGPGRNEAPWKPPRANLVPKVIRPMPTLEAAPKPSGSPRRATGAQGLAEGGAPAR